MNEKKIKLEKITWDHHTVIASKDDHAAIMDCKKISVAANYHDAVLVAQRFVNEGYIQIYILKTLEFVKFIPDVCEACGQPLPGEVKT